ncbi:MAG: ABC transporter permease [Tidjanibacter sp.]|nr:ABC transporter permease [Tidjanibacter sp.]
MRNELRTISHTPATALVVVGGVIIYGLLYNLFYAPNVVREAPIIVVDESHSHLSERFILLTDASPSAEVITTAASLHEGQEMLQRGEGEALLYLPHDIEERIGRGEQAVVVTFATTNTFLYYEATAEAVVEASLALGEEVREGMAWILPEEVQFALSTRQPITPEGIALFNPSKGYATYLLPVVLMIIIFQTLTMVVAMTSAGRRAKGVSFLRTPTTRLWQRVTVVIGRTTIHATLYSAFSCFLVGLLPRLFELPHLASVWTLVGILTPFILATSLFGQCFGKLFEDSDAPLLLITFFSVGLIFIAGISYPLELLPSQWRALHYIFPSSPAILAYTATASMGATLPEVSREIAVLWVQVGAYFLLAAIPSRGFR